MTKASNAGMYEGACITHRLRQTVGWLTGLSCGARATPLRLHHRPAPVYSTMSWHAVTTNTTVLVRTDQLSSRETTAGM